MVRDKDFTDGFYRAVILDWFKQSKYKQNKKMQDFIMYEASYSDIVLAVTRGKPFCQEANDSTRALAIKKAEESSSMYMDLIGFLFGGMATEAAAKKYGLTSSQLASKGFKFFSGKRAAWAAARVGMGWIVAPALLVWIARKAIFGTLRKVNKKCRLSCEARISKDIKDRNLAVKICNSKCKIVDLKRSIAKIKGQLSTCNSKDVKNPDKCKSGLYKTIGQFNELVEKENETLKNNVNKFRSKQEFIKRKEQSQTKPIKNKRMI